jgi:hypothetical protein
VPRRVAQAGAGQRSGPRSLEALPREPFADLNPATWREKARTALD